MCKLNFVWFWKYQGLCRDIFAGDTTRGGEDWSGVLRWGEVMCSRENTIVTVGVYSRVVFRILSSCFFKILYYITFVYHLIGDYTINVFENCLLHVYNHAMISNLFNIFIICCNGLLPTRSGLRQYGPGGSPIHIRLRLRLCLVERLKSYRLFILWDNDIYAPRSWHIISFKH